jgi:hypothetical protein
LILSIGICSERRFVCDVSRFDQVRHLELSISDEVGETILCNRTASARATTALSKPLNGEKDDIPAFEVSA